MRRKKTMALVQTDLQECYKLFLEEHIARGTADSTMGTYKLHINSFIKYVSEGVSVNASIIDKQAWIYYIQELMEDENKADTTVTSYCRSIRTFIYWLMDNNYTEQEHLMLPKCEQRIKEIYTEEEIATLLQRPVDGCSEVEYQTWVFINLIMATGLRLSSALNLKVSDYVKKEQLLYVQKMKNKQAQQMYLSDEVCTILNRYIKLFDLEEDDYFFCTANKTRLAKRTIQDNVAEYNRKRGLTKTSIHLMRHTFATKYYLATKDIYSLKLLMNHSSLAVTENYIKNLGLTPTASVAYNPQQLFVTKQITTNKRRSRKMK